VEITDHGVGISAEEQEHIFDPYYRTREAVRSKVAGEGVGLYISDQIVKAHGGRLRVRSSLGKGSTFTIELPLVEAVCDASL
jgi:signal transduction histidine kinase